MITANPFPHDPDRSAIWEMLVTRDIAAYARNDWTMVADDFVADHEFVTLDARGRPDPDFWTLGRDLDGYRERWLAGSAELLASVPAPDLEADLHAATTLRDIDVRGSDAIAHKKFDGPIRAGNDAVAHLDWQTLYLCRRDADRWRIRGFVGYLPRSGLDHSPAMPRKRVPTEASQHVTAGPYSPVLDVAAERLVVISGQAAILPDGSVFGPDLEQQTELTLWNCRDQLTSAGCRLEDVVKVNAYLRDLSNWNRFNRVYAAFMPKPHPVRTVVGAALLPDLEVEIEMWAVAR